MSSCVKQHILHKVFENIFSRAKIASVEQIAPYLTVDRLENNNPEFQLNLPLTVEFENEKEYQSVQINSAQIQPDDIIIGSKLTNQGCLRLTVDSKTLIKDVLESNPTLLNFKPQKRKTIVEFSSPNVAKPFHVGHLRSTIIGNFVANIKAKLGRDVYKINYLGDWGKQYGLLKLGVDLSGVTEEALKAHPTRTLYEAYVWANQQANIDRTMHDKARDEFRKLESGDEESIAAWNKYRNASVAELEKAYQRVGVKFDEYQWESNYGKEEVERMIERLREQGLIRIDEKERICAVVRGRKVPLVKSDGTTLYLARDVAAVLDRRRKLDFTDMYYVVENGQSDHFVSLFSICNDFGVDQSWNLRHVKFGRIHGMSTRRGKVVFLEDILDQARDIVMERLKAAKTSKVEPNLELADALGCASVIINDLKQRRVKDYDFSWDKALQVSGDTALRLQYAHCRLCSLLSNSAYSPAEQCDPDAFSEPEAMALILEIARYEEAVLRSHAELESCILVNYLFCLCHAANKAFKTLPVKDSGGHLGGQRLLLFNTCRKVLGEGLMLLGVTPLERM